MCPAQRSKSLDGWPAARVAYWEGYTFTEQKGSKGILGMRAIADDLRTALR